MIFWDLYSFQPRDICQVFSKTFQDYQVCQMWLGLPQQQRPWTPSCQSNWIVSPYQPQYAQGGCGIPWYPQPIPMPMPIPTPKGKELLRIQVADRAAGPNNTITFKLSAVPDTNEIAPYKFTKQSCKDGYCSQEQLIGRVNQEEFKSLQAKAGAAKSGTIVEPPRPEIQCLAYGPRTTYLANNGETLLLIDESCGGAVLKNMSTAAADLVTWLKSKQK